MKSLKILILILFCSIGLFGQESIQFLKGSGTGGAADTTPPDAPTNLLAEVYTQSVYFVFSDSIDATTSTAVISNPIVPTGFTGPLDISVSGGDYRLSVLDSWTRTRGIINSGDTLWVLDTTSASNLTTTNVLLTISAVTDTFSVTTVASGGEQMEVTRWKTGLALNDSTVTHINNFVTMVKDTFALDSLSQMWNVILVQANETPLASLHNLVKRSNDADTNFTMEWTQWEGWNGDRTDNFNDGYIDLNYNPYADANITAMDDLSVSVFMRDDYDANGGIDAGVMIAATSDSGWIHLTIRRDDNELGFRVNDLFWSSPLVYNTGVDSSRGLYTITRSGTNKYLYKNNVQMYTDANPGQSFPNKTMLMFRNQNSADALPTGLNSPKQASFLFIGKHLSLAQHQSLFNICKAFLQSVGKDVTTY